MLACWPGVAATFMEEAVADRRLAAYVHTHHLITRELVDAGLEFQGAHLARPIERRPSFGRCEPCASFSLLGFRPL